MTAARSTAYGPCVRVNGRPRHLARPLSIAALLAELGLEGRLAVEINGRVVPRSRHGQHLLHDLDRIEIVRAVGGG